MVTVTGQGDNPRSTSIFFYIFNHFLILGPQNTHNQKKTWLFVVPTFIWEDHFDSWIEPSSTSTGGCSGNPSAQRSEDQHRHPALVWKKHRRKGWIFVPGVKTWMFFPTKIKIPKKRRRSMRRGGWFHRNKILKMTSTVEKINEA